MKYGKICLLMLVLSVQEFNLVAQPHGDQGLYELVEACLGDCAIILKPLLRLVIQNQDADDESDDLIGRDGSWILRDHDTGKVQNLFLSEDWDKQEVLKLQAIERLRTPAIVTTVTNDDVVNQDKDDLDFYAWQLPVDEIRKRKKFALKKTGLDVCEDLALPPLESCYRVQKKSNA